MLGTKVITLPMDEQQWEKLGVQQEGSSLFISICLAEREVLNFLDGKKEVTLTHIIDQLGLPEPIILMSIGSLITEGIIAARRHNKFILLYKKI